MPRIRFARHVAVLALALLPITDLAVDAQNGQTSRDEILLGFHYGDMSNHEGRRKDDDPLNIWPFFQDYLEHMEDELLATSYADFWRWWYILERYKGDEKGLEEFDKIVDACLERGLKIKAVLAWDTWWTRDRDWEVGSRLPFAPDRLENWIHFCDLVGRRYHGRIAMWDLEGEANDIEHYWEGAELDYVYQVYKAGYRVLRRVDPGGLVGISNASPSVSREKLDEWYWNNISNCVGHYDNIPMNYFADVADPYKGVIHYYNSLRDMLDKTGQQHVEVGMGETSFQWAETTVGAAKDPFTMKRQSEALNDTYGQLLHLGMNKHIAWATEFAPGGGHWPWRWGYRNYEDWWGIWPDDFKVPGTQIIYKFQPAEGEAIDLRPEWPRPTDPYYPAWELYRFWGQLAPAGSETVRVPLKANGPQGTIWNVAGFQRARNEIVGLVYNDQEAEIHVAFDLEKTGWATDTTVVIEASNETIDMKTGEHARRWQQQWSPDSIANLSVELPESVGFTTLRIRPAPDAPDATLEGQVITREIEIGAQATGFVVLRNTGGESWDAATVLAHYADNALDAESSATFGLPHAVPPGRMAAIEVSLSAPHAMAGHYHIPLRLRRPDGSWIGPVVGVWFRTVEREAPRKLVAHREIGHVRLKWFAPVRSENVQAYEIYRANDFEQPFELLIKTEGTDTIDVPPTLDHPYYYHVVAVFADGRRSRPSNEDNALALSKPRIYDAEILSHNVPALVRIGDRHQVKVTVRNTGTKTWDLSRPKKLRYWLQPTRLWNVQNERQLAEVAIEDRAKVEPGEEITLEFPFVGPRVGRFENHWILRMEVPGTRAAAKSGWESSIQYAYFGTPLLVETEVHAK